LKILEKDSKDTEVNNEAEERLGIEMERQRQQKILSRIEFEKQIQTFNQKELLKVLMRKEAQEANKDYWDQQISQAKARSTQEKNMFDNGGVAAAFLDKIFD
jgi:isopentenyldiphosphate isomerase